MGTPSRDLMSFGSVIRSRMAPLASELNQYLTNDTTSARDRARLFHLAWDVSCSSFSSRQVLYERMFGGNPLRDAMTLFTTYDKERFRKQVQNFLESDD
jgi:4-hydroxyphenylacetate 3-monooxygenase